MLDWFSKKTTVLCNPKAPAFFKQLISRLPLEGPFQGHLWLATSGSRGEPGTVKFVALAKEALLASAEAVNQHLHIASKDIWINPLPSFHVGGLGILARSALNGAKVIPLQGKWDPFHFVKQLKENNGTFSSLVPTQVFDLIKAGYQAPSCLRAIIVGGGELAKPLYEKAYLLGWKLLPSYGLTEAASQVATALTSSEEYPKMTILPHLIVRSDAAGFFCLKGPSLLTAYAYLNREACHIIDPKEEGWFRTEDQGWVEGQTLHMIGREGDFIKIGGESVHLKPLEALLEKLLLELKIDTDLALAALPDERLGHVLHLALAGDSSQSHIDRLLKAYHEKVLPFERIQKIHWLKEIPRSPLHKVLQINLQQAIKRARDSEDDAL